MTERVLATKLLLKEAVKSEKKTESGIIIPDIGKQPTSVATIVLVGKGTSSLPMVAEVGDRVLFSPHAVTRLTIPENEETKDLGLKGEYLLLDIKDVLLLF